MNPKLRIVVDTNVIVSAFIKPHSFLRHIVNTVLQDHVFLCSAETFLELEERLLHSKFDRYVSQSIRQEFLHSLPSFVNYVDVTSKINACRDPKDNKFLELAVDGKAKYIITGDSDLLVLNPFRGIKILMP